MESGVATLGRAAVGVAGRGVLGATLCCGGVGVRGQVVLVATLCRAAVGVAGRGVLVATLCPAPGVESRTGRGACRRWRAAERVVIAVAV